MRISSIVIHFRDIQNGGARATVISFYNYAHSDYTAEIRFKRVIDQTINYADIYPHSIQMTGLVRMTDSDCNDTRWVSLIDRVIVID